jgi:Flp pilus assembly secretin CpaC
MPWRLGALWVACWAIWSILPAPAVGDEKTAGTAGKSDNTHKESKLQVALEVHLLTVPEGLLERFALDHEHMNLPVHTAQSPSGTPSVQVANPQGMNAAFLKDSDVFQLMQAAQGDVRTTCVQMPRLVIADGETGVVDVTDTQFYLTGVKLDRGDEGAIMHATQVPFKLGVQMSAQPRISADRHFVRLALHINVSNLASPTIPLIPVQIPIPGPKGETQIFTQFLQQPQISTLSLDTTLNVPDGGTVLLGGIKRVAEGRNEFGPPVLSKVPYVNRLFKNVGYGREVQTSYVLVTPRILVNGKKDAKVAASCPPCLDRPCLASPTSRTDQPDSGLRLAGGKVVEEERVCPTGRHTNLVAELLKAYDEACAAGNTGEAERLARAALILNPECFHNRRRFP